MSKTVIDILQECVGRGRPAVLVQRHGEYFLEPLIARLKRDYGYDDRMAKAEAYVRGFCGTESDLLLTLNSVGVKTARNQGWELGIAGIPITEVFGSGQSRGTGTGLFICEGYYEGSQGTWLPASTHQALNKVRQAYDVALPTVLDQLDGKPYTAVQDWLRGDLPDLVPDETPTGFWHRVHSFIMGLLLSQNGIYVLGTHYEVLLVAHAQYVTRVGQNLVDNWEPVKSGGVIIWKDGDNFQAHDYDAKFMLLR